MNREQFIIWFTGLFEGEGTFNIVKSTAKCISLTSTDLDVLERIQQYIGGNICTSKRIKENWKQAYIWSLSGLQAKNIVEEIKPFLLQRRNNRAQDWLDIFNQNVTNQELKKTEIVEKHLKVIELGKLGITHLEIALQTGYERSSVSKILNKHGVYSVNG